jgi:hypothetical protein
MVTSLVILTKFSLASMYCDRLIAVFLGASNPQRPDAFRTSLYDNLNLDQLSVHRLQVLNLFMFFECETGCHHERRGGVHGLCPTCRQSASRLSSDERLRRPTRHESGNGHGQHHICGADFSIL